MALKNIPQAERLLSGTLTSYLSDVATTCVMSDPPSKFPTYIDIEPDSTTKKELVRAVAVSGSTVTIERSVNGVTTDHAANATYKQKLTSRHWDAVSDALEKGYLMEDALRVLIRVSDTQFTITGYGASDDLTTKYAVGRYLRSNSSNSYVTQVTSSSYAAGTNKTTVNVADTLPTPLSTIEMAIGAEGGFAHLKVKATAAEVATGTDDTKIVTPKALKDAGVPSSKATGSDVTTGTDNAKYITAAALAGIDTKTSTYSNMGISSFIAPANATSGSTLTTSGTTPLTVQEITITNPPVAGQIFIVATFGMNSASVANDYFTYALYFGTTPTLIKSNTQTVYTTGGGGRHIVTISGVAAVATSGTQLIRLVVTRGGGTGTIASQSGETGVSWIIIPGAGTTA